MRPVDLTPPEQRAGSRPPTRTGPLPYMLLSLLVLVLFGVVAIVFTNNEMAEAEADKQNLEYELARLSAEANELAPYVDFATVSATRTETVRALAMSRFDWHRVMQELSLVLPDDVWLVNLTATVGPGVSLPNAAQVGNRAEVDSPAIQMVGCGASQTKVAEFLAALEDIDGVTRVGLVSSQRRAAGSGGGDTGGGNDCRTRGYIWQFEVLAVFDSVPAPEGSDVPVAPVEPTPEESEQPVDGSENSDDTDGSGSGSGSDDSGEGSDTGNGNGNGNGGSGNGNGNGNGNGGGNGAQ